MRVGRGELRNMRERKANKAAMVVRQAQSVLLVKVRTSYTGARGFWPIERKRGGATPPSARKLWTGVKAREITIANKPKG